jgi:hypothetical protein
MKPQQSPLGELLGSGQQQLADAVQRIALAAPVTQGHLLGPAADLINHQVGQPDGVEVVHPSSPLRSQARGRDAGWNPAEA